MPLMGVREYARHRGVSPAAVRKAIDTGRITRRKDGKINSTTADRQWNERTDHSKPRNSITGDPKHRREKDEPETPMGMSRGRRRPRVAAAPKGNGHANGNGNGEEPEQLSVYAQARGEREQFQALLAKLEYEKAAGLVVDAEAVKQAAFDAGRRARDLLMTLPARVAPILAAMDSDAEVYDTLDKALRQVCDEIAKGGEGKGGAGRRRGKK